jgi:hypothetical protein
MDPFHLPGVMTFFMNLEVRSTGHSICMVLAWKPNAVDHSPEGLQRGSGFLPPKGKH